MKKSREKPDNEIERLEAEIRELKQTNRSLLKRLKKVDKGYVKVKADRELKIPKDELEEDFDCVNCGKGYKQEAEIGPRKIVTCTNCDYRKIENSK